MTMQKNRSFSVRQHDRVGAELQSIYDRLTRIAADLSKAYPVKSDFINSTEKTAGCLHRLRKQLNDSARQEHGSTAGNPYFREDESP